MSEREVKMMLIEKADAMAKEIVHGKDISITKTASGLKIMSETKKTVR